MVADPKPLPPPTVADEMAKGPAPETLLAVGLGPRWNGFVCAPALGRAGENPTGHRQHQHNTGNKTAAPAAAKVIDTTIPLGVCLLSDTPYVNHVTK